MSVIWLFILFKMPAFHLIMADKLLQKTAILLKIAGFLLKMADILL